ncbi:MAG: rhomboid family intramembrane serine protease [Chitinophagaceae bacterium]
MANYGSGGFSLPPVIKNLMIINALVWLAQIAAIKQGIYLEEYGALLPIGSGQFKGWQLITYMFMHEAVNINGGIVLAHIGFNMLGLWIFGTDLEYYWGPKRFLIFYLLCGVFAGIAQLLVSPSGYTIGASGAVMGVSVACAYLFPNKELYIYALFPVKIKYLVPFYVLMDLFSGFGSNDGVAHFAHLGGALAGFLIVLYWNRSNRKDFY